MRYRMKGTQDIHLSDGRCIEGWKLRRDEEHKPVYDTFEADLEPVEEDLFLRTGAIERLPSVPQAADNTKAPKTSGKRRE